MPLVTTTEMFKKAYEGGYAIGAFNVNNMEIVQGITLGLPVKDIDMAIRTVCKAKAVTVVVDRNAVFFGGLDITDDVVQELKKKSSGS